MTRQKETVVNESDEGGSESAVSYAGFKVRVGVEIPDSLRK